MQNRVSIVEWKYIIEVDREITERKYIIKVDRESSKRK